MSAPIRRPSSDAPSPAPAAFIRIPEPAPSDVGPSGRTEVFSFNDDFLTWMNERPYNVLGFLGKGGFGIVHKVELLTPLGWTVNSDAVGLPDPDFEGTKGFTELALERIMHSTGSIDEEAYNSERGRLNRSGFCFALKKMSPGAGSDHDSDWDDCLREVKLMRALKKSESIVRIVDAKILDQGPRAAFILMELGEMDFDTYLQSSAPAADGIMPHCQGQGFHGGEKNMSRPSRLSEGLGAEEIFFWWLQILAAVNAVHDHGIVHCDLKPQNFILFRRRSRDHELGTGAPIHLFEPYRLKLCDFGVSRELEDSATHVSENAPIGTVRYMAPEVVHHSRSDGKVCVGNAADNWSIGVILHQMLHQGLTPHSHVERKKHKFKLMLAIADEKSARVKTSCQRLLTCPDGFLQERAGGERDLDSTAKQMRTPQDEVQEKSEREDLDTAKQVRKLMFGRHATLMGLQSACLQYKVYKRATTDRLVSLTEREGQRFFSGCIAMADVSFESTIDEATRRERKRHRRPRPERRAVFAPTGSVSCNIFGIIGITVSVMGFLCVIGGFGVTFPYVRPEGHDASPPPCWEEPQPVIVSPTSFLTTIAPSPPPPPTSEAEPLPLPSASSSPVPWLLLPEPDRLAWSRPIGLGGFLTTTSEAVGVGTNRKNPVSSSSFLQPAEKFTTEGPDTDMEHECIHRGEDGFPKKHGETIGQDPEEEEGGIILDEQEDEEGGIGCRWCPRDSEGAQLIMSAPSVPLNRHCLQIDVDPGDMDATPAFTRVLDHDHAPEREYRRRQNDRKTVLVHWGQRKLFLSEIEFLTRFAGGTSGAAPVVSDAGTTAGSKSVGFSESLSGAGGGVQNELDEINPSSGPSGPGGPRQSSRSASSSRRIAEKKETARTARRSPRTICIYAGAAPGTHLVHLSDMFPEVEFVLIDPRPFDTILKKRAAEAGSRIQLRNEYFSDAMAREIREQFSAGADHNDSEGGPDPEGGPKPNMNGARIDVLVGSSANNTPHNTANNAPNNAPPNNAPTLLFLVSDVRTSENASAETAVAADYMALQKSWFRHLQPTAALFKFRLPWTPGTTSYLKGEIQLPVFGPTTTIETRLLVLGRDNGEEKEYDHTKYERQMFWFNTVQRVGKYEAEMGCSTSSGVDVEDLSARELMFDYYRCCCYDCCAEKSILERYLRLRSRDELEADSSTTASKSPANQELIELSRKLDRVCHRDHANPRTIFDPTPDGGERKARINKRQKLNV